MSVIPEVELICIIPASSKIDLTSNIPKTVKDTMLDSTEIRQKTNHGLSIGTINFDQGWPLILLVQGH